MLDSAIGGISPGFDPSAEEPSGVVGRVAGPLVLVGQFRRPPTL